MLTWSVKWSSLIWRFIRLLGDPMRTVGVVGGSGFIGRHVVAAITQRGLTPIVIGAGEARDATIEVRPASATDVDGITEALEGCDAVVHLAARSGGIQMQNDVGVFVDNRTMTDTVLEACRRQNIQDVFLASSQVVYRSGAEPLPESAPIMSSADGPTQYTWSKATDEVVGQWWGEQNGSRIVFGRFGNIYGPGAPYDPSRSTVVHALIQRFAEAEPASVVTVWGDGSTVRSFLHVEDAGRAVVDVLTHGAPGSVYNIDSGTPVTIEELARAINDAVGHHHELFFDASKPSGTPYRVGSNARLTELGFVQRIPLEEGLHTTVDDYRQRFMSDG